MYDILGYAVEVTFRIAYVGRTQSGHLSRNAVYRLIHQILGVGTTATDEETNEMAPDLLVAFRSAIAIRIKPFEQLVEFVFSRD